MSIGPSPLDDLVQEFFGDKDTHEFASLTPDNLTRGTIMATAFNRARAALDARRRNFLTEFGLDASGTVDPRLQFGAFQNLTRDIGHGLDQFEGNSAARGFLGGSGLARSGAGQARDIGLGQLDQQARDRINTLANFGQERLGRGEQFKFDLLDLKQQNIDDKIADEQFTPTPPPGSGPAADAEADSPSPAAERTGKQIAKAGQLARNRLFAARRAGLKIGAIPKDPSNAAAKWRRVSARLSPQEHARLKKHL